MCALRDISKTLHYTSSNPAPLDSLPGPPTVLTHREPLVFLAPGSLLEPEQTGNRAPGTCLKLSIFLTVGIRSHIYLLFGHKKNTVDYLLFLAGEFLVLL